MSGRVRLKIAEEDFNKLQRLLMERMPDESAAFMLAGKHEEGDSLDLIVRRVVEIPASEYRVRNNYHMEISSSALNGLMALCEKNGLGAVLCHSHEHGAVYSPSDDQGESRIADVLGKFIPNMPVGSLLLTQSGEINGRIWGARGKCERISSVVVLGHHISQITIVVSSQHQQYSKAEIYDRQVKTFGELGQTRLNEAKIGIVGVGGTGSAVAEQLARMGVKDFVLIDSDDFEPTNLTRMHETRYTDAYPRLKKGKEAKVNLIAKRLRSIAPRIKTNLSNENVVKKEACRLLLDRDVIFSCTDDHWGRALLNQVAHQYLIPVINLGVRVDSKDGKISGAAGDVSILRPGKPCLWCYGFLNPERIRSESLPTDVRDGLLREGYVQGIDDKSPSVVSLTTTVSGLAVTLFLQLLTDFMGIEGDIALQKYNIMEGDVRRGTAAVKPDCCCQSYKGYGDMRPLHVI